MSGTEAQFAGCLLHIGGPPKLKLRGDKQSYPGEPVTTTSYMFAATKWYDEHVEPPPTTIGEHSRFTEWWLDYKLWLVENRHEQQT